MKKIFWSSLLMMALANCCVGAVSYSIRELPTLPGGTGNGAAKAINESGQIVGIANDASENNHAVIWNTDGSIKVLGELPGHSISWAVDINDKGQVVGWSGETGNKNKHAVIWQPDGTIKDLGTLGGPISAATAINNNGYVVGQSITGGPGMMHAFIWKPETGMVDLGAPGKVYRYYASDIDDSGRAIGWTSELIKEGSGASFYRSRAVIWDINGTLNDISVTFGGKFSSATAINSAGQIAGYAGSQTNVNAFLWSEKDGLKDLGRLQFLPAFTGFVDSLSTPGSYGKALNDTGQVVGSSSGKNTNIHAFFWSLETGMIDLGTLQPPKKDTPEPAPDKTGSKKHLMTVKLRKPFEGINWSEASGINNAGTIIGSSNGHPVVWTPLR